MRGALLFSIVVFVFSVFILNYQFGTAEGEQAAKAKEAPDIGQVIFVNEISGNERTKQLGSRLHFCFFENGEKDCIYVAIPHGYWENGEVDLLVDGAVASTIKVPSLSDMGALIKLDNVVDKLRQPNGLELPQLSIDNIRGTFK